MGLNAGLYVVAYTDMQFNRVCLSWK